MADNETITQDQTAKEYYEKFVSNPTNGYLNHHDIFSLLMSKMESKDKLDFINKYTKADPPFENLKGLNKSVVIDKIVKPILANTDDAARMMLKADINAMKEAAESKFQTKKFEKGEIVFVESTLSSEEYMNLLVKNRDSIKNGAKNENSVSTPMLLLAYYENGKSKNKFHEILTKSGVSVERANEFIKTGIFNHTPVTNEIKKLTAQEINSNIENVNIFKELTNFKPSKTNTNVNEIEVKNEKQIKR